jgi:hypothetical protein
LSIGFIRFVGGINGGDVAVAGAISGGLDGATGGGLDGGGGLNGDDGGGGGYWPLTSFPEDVVGGINGGGG